MCYAWYAFVNKKKSVLFAEQCYFRGKIYDHGESPSIVECTHCVCADGTMQCKKYDPEKTCPPLTCPLKDQVIVPGECCKVCLGM